MHTCFDHCKDPADCFLGFDSDKRSECNSTSRDQGILCLIPEQNSCEDYMHSSETCLNDKKTLCLNWRIIFIAIFVSNALQIVFEGGLLHSLEITFKPTSLDRLQDPDKFKDELSGGGGGDSGNPDQKKELDCDTVLNKCFGEFLFIGSYLFVACSLVVGLAYQIKYGKIQTILLELIIAYAIDQVLSIPSQVLIYYTVIRRFGRLENMGFEEWND